MPNPFFKFKQFTIYHDQCAMKVGTDGVLLGAWIQAKSPKSILDIGSGTGLIALMLAQKFTSAQIIGIELESKCAEQSVQNCKESIFHQRVKIINSSIQNFNPYGEESAKKTFDCLVSNPPYFQGAHTSGSQNRDLARHNNSLEPKQLWEAVERLSHEKSTFNVILPTIEGNHFIALAKEFRWHVTRLCEVKGTSSAKAKRLLIEFSKTEKEYTTETLLLEISRGQRTPEYSQLTKDFYLEK